MTYLKATDLSRHFGGVAALDNASFSAEKGEIHALLGENGAGKSTFIKILAGAQRSDSGSIEIEGKDVSGLTPRRAKLLGVSAVFQELSLVPDFDVARNVWLEAEPRTPLGTLSGRKMRRATEALFDELGFPPLPFDVPVRTLPIAARQLIEIAKGMAGKPTILILDEPTSALAPKEVDMVMDLMARHREAGGLCIFISHRLSEVRRIADQVTILRNGTDITTLSPNDADDDTIITHIIGRRMDQLFPPRSENVKSRVMLEGTDLSDSRRLHGVDLTVREGEILGVGGLQGQGQRELFLRLFGALRGGGTIKVDGEEKHIRNPHEALAAGVGCALIPEDRQHEGLLLAKSVRENLTLSRLEDISRFGVISRERERDISQALIRELEIVVDRDSMAVDGLSGGNQQKVVIGKFLSPVTRILLCYDPTRGVDIGARHAIFELMHRLAGEGMAILFFSTDNSELINVADRVLVLAGGRVSAVLEREGLSEATLVRSALGDALSKEEVETV